MLNLLYTSDSDDQAVYRPRDYANALVSTSLESDSSFCILSPSQSTPTQLLYRAEALPMRGRTQKEPSPDSSLDELIESFRASASSLKFTSIRDTEPTGIPVKNSHDKKTPARQPPAAKTKSILRHGAPPLVTPGNRDDELVGLSPMPKLTYVPKRKPSLSIPAPAKPGLKSGIKPPSRFQLPMEASSREAAKPKPNRSKLVSPKKLVQATIPQPRYKARALPSPPTSSSSSQSAESSVLEEIEAPDTEGTGEMSVDELISRDLHRLRRLVSSSQEQLALPKERVTNQPLTSEEIERGLRRNTRFRADSDEEHMSSFRLYSPHDRPSSASSFRLEPMQSLLHKQQQCGHRTFDPDDHEDPFVEELRTMKSNVLKGKEKKKFEDAVAKKKAEDEERIKALQVPGAKITSLREAIETIDKNLLLALHPFEMRRQVQEKEGQAVAEEKNSIATPMTTQAIVDQLEHTFGGLTRQREVELKAEEDAVAQAKAAEEAKVKEEYSKKTLAESARRKQEDEILSLLPLRGKLMNTEGDIHDALVRLEFAESLAQRPGRHPSTVLMSASSLQQDVIRLREFADRRAQEIDDLITAPAGAPRAMEWHRSVFHIDQSEEIESEDHELHVCARPDDESYSDVVKSEVMEKLDFTILKLKHALNIDQKEAEEAKIRQRQIEGESIALQKKKSEEKSKQAKLESDAAAARQRVMGISSLDDLQWVAEGNSRLHHGGQDDSALVRLQNSLDAHTQEFAARAPSFFEENQAAERFESVRTMMEPPPLHSIHKSRSSPVVKYREMRSSSKSTWHPAENDKWRQQTRDSDYSDEQDVFISHRKTASIALPSRTKGSYMTPRSNYELEDFPHRERNSSVHVDTREVNDRRAPREKPVDLKRAMRDLQASRRDKTRWLYASTRSR